MKKIICSTLSLALILTGCSSSKKSGTYLGEAEGFGGIVKTYVTLNEGKVVDVYVEGENETIGKGSLAIEQLPAKIIEKGNSDVDCVAGATVTSNAIKEGFKNALLSKETVDFIKPEVKIEFKDGTYTANAFGHNTPVSVEVTLADNKIENVVVTEDKSDTAMHDLTVETIPERIVSNQSLNVDVVTGATETSSAIINAVGNAIEQASSLEVVNALKTKEKAVSEIVNETYDADVVVVGGGGSGLTTAYSLTEKGFKVVVLEAADILGGMTNVCGGGSLSIGSKLQKEDGKFTYEDGEVEKLKKEYRQLIASQTNDDKYEDVIISYADALDDYVDWANAAGIQYSVNSPTGVRLENKGSRFYTVIEKMKEAGTEILTGTRGTELLMDHGRITGVKGINKTGGETVVNARAVVLSTGGFLANEKMVKEEFGDLYDLTDWENWSGSSRYQGDAINMALAAGAVKDATGTQPHDSQIPEKLRNYEIATHFPVLMDTVAYLPNLWVDKTGVRFCSEDLVVSSAEEHGKATMLAGGYYSVVDEATIDSFEKDGQPLSFFMSTKDKPLTGLKDQLKLAEEAGAVVSGTVDEVAKKLNMDPETLLDTITKYNEAVKNKKDDEFGKNPEYLYTTIDTDGVIYAVKNNVRNLAAYGGLFVNGNLEVMSENGAIKGLYATGLDALSFMGPVYSISTVTAGFAIASGYIAGNSVAEYLGK